MIDELRQLQVRQREAHFNGDASQMVSLFADDFVSVLGGEVSRPTRETSRGRFERYFARVNFVAWDDIVEPTVEVSRDGTLATVLVHKRVHITYREEGWISWCSEARSLSRGGVATSGCRVLDPQSAGELVMIDTRQQQEDSTRAAQSAAAVAHAR
jgi:hypothetical protein